MLQVYEIMYHTTPLKMFGFYWYLLNYKVNFILKNTKNLKKGLYAACGRGEHAWSLTLKGKAITGIDINKKEIKIAKNLRNLYDSKNYLNALFYVMNASDLKFSNKSFDFSFCFDLHHISNWQPAIDEMIRVSRHKILINEVNPKSKLALIMVKLHSIFTNIDKNVSFITPEQIMNYLEIRTSSLKFISTMGGAFYWIVADLSGKVESQIP